MAHVLVVDDVPDNVKLLEDDLIDEGHDVLTANNGEEALRIAAAEHPDLILLDLMMPNMDGFEVCRRLKADPHLRSISIVIVSASHNVDDIVRGLDLGADDYIAKPLKRQIVAARVRSVLRAKFVHDQLEAASQTKSEFLANISHEIRTPMTAVLGFAGLLEESLVKPENIEAIHAIKQNSEYLLELIDDLLDISKIEAGKLEVEQIECSPCRIIADVASLFRVRAETKDLAFDVEFDGPIPKTIQSDPTRLRQILINLVGNAIKFTEIGNVKLVTRLLDRNGKEPTLQFDVIDNGIGMTEQQASTVFQPFAQADASTTRKFGGTGLGLAISKRLAEALHGNITVNCVLEQGCAFCLTIGCGSLENVELLEDPQQAMLESSQANRSIPQTRTKLACRILLAEDVHYNQRLISILLKKAGADVTVADNGQIAVDLALSADADGKPFDLILMDMQMPVLDGYSAAGRLREAGLSIPIIALTAHAMSGARKKCFQAGCDDFLSKPINQKKMLALIAEWTKDDRPKTKAKHHVPVS